MILAVMLPVGLVLLSLRVLLVRMLIVLHHLLVMVLLLLLQLLLQLLLLCKSHSLGNCCGLGHQLWILKKRLAHRVGINYASWS